MKTRFAVWLFLISTFLQSLVAFPVFTYNGTAASQGASSIAILETEVELPDSFIFCASVKQARFDDTRFYSLAGRDSRQWMKMRFRTFPDATKLTLNWGDTYHILKAIRNPRLDFWYHICVRVDLKKNEIEVALNGEHMGRVMEKNITNKPSKFGMTFGRDYYYNEQFQGSISNIYVLKEGNLTELSTFPCAKRQNALLQWNPLDWKVVGIDWSLIEEYEDTFCNMSKNYNLAIPLQITFKGGIDICKHKLNSISPWENNHEWFQRYMAWHQNITEGACPYIWTPFSDEHSEGSFINMNNFSETEILFWAKAEPNGRNNENFVTINVGKAALIDVPKTFLSCGTCLVSSSLLLQLDGLGQCPSSLIGTSILERQFNYSKLISDKKYKILNTQSSIGFNGWRNMYIRS